MRAHSRSLVVLGVPFALLATIAACGGSGTPTPSPSTSVVAPSQTTSTATAEAPTDVASEPSPPATPIEQVLVFPGPNPGTAVSLRIVDGSGTLLKARQATRGEIQRVAIIPDTIGVVGLPGDDRSLYARWSSNICEGETTVRIDAAIRSVEVRQPPRKHCDAVGTFVDLVLTFSGSADKDLVTADLLEAG
jgi:predicted small lipoprotein YifL